MQIIEIPRDTDRFVLYFSTPKHEINAYALATVLMGFSDAVTYANAAVNPGHRIEVIVEALEDGSFQAKIKTVYTQAKNLFSSEPAKAIIYGIISTFIYEHSFNTGKPPTITISSDMTVIEQDGKQIVVPTSVYEATKQVKKSERFTNAVGQIFKGANSDPNITGIGLKVDSSPNPPTIIIPREQFALLECTPEIEDGSRERIEFATLEISRAILSRGSRKWEFFWRGIKIPAPVLDESFYDKFFAHEITIAPGDSLSVTLRVIQKQDRDTGIFINEHYEVIEVHEHIPRLKLQNF
jgi:hypothetical protein